MHCVTPHLNINLIKWNITQDNIKGQFAEYQVTPYKYPRYLKMKYYDTPQCQ